MQVAAMHFKARAGEKLADGKLQAALRKLQGNFVKGRAERVLELDNFEDIRTAAAAIRDRALDNLDAYLEEFERNATARGAVVHWAETTAEVNRIVCELAAKYGVRKAVKSKSMVSERRARGRRRGGGRNRSGRIYPAARARAAIAHHCAGNP
jgi:L-lactate dehydrogenase complex protein LldF